MKIMIHAGISCLGLLQEMPIRFSIFVFLPPLFHHDLETAQRIPVIFSPFERWDLDQCVPEKPAVFYRRCHHVAVLNSVALKACSIGAETKETFFVVFFCSEKCFFFKFDEPKQRMCRKPSPEKFEHHSEQI